MLMYYIVLSLVWASVLLWSLLLFFLVGDPFILAHAIGALLYLCIHRSVQHKKSIESFLCDLSKKKKVVFVRKRKRSRHCEARTHDIHVIARRCTTRKLPPPPVYHGGPKANKQAFNSAQTDILRTRLCGTRSGAPSYGVYSWVEILSNLRWSSPGMMHGSVGRPLAWQDDSATSSQVTKLYRIMNLLH